jgi:hypothetical protein
MTTNQNDVLSWTSQDPRQSQLFSPWGVVYRFQVRVIEHRCALMVLISDSQTETNAQGQSTTTVWRAIRANKEDRVAKLEWAAGGGLGRAVIGKVRPSFQRTCHLTSFLRSPLDHSTMSLWPTWSAETHECPCVFWSCLVLISI